MEYSNEHRKLLQKMLVEPSQSKESFYKLYQECFHEEESRNGVDDRTILETIKLMNTKLRPLRMAIKQRRCEDTGKDFIVLINTTDSLATRSSLEFKTTETELFKKIVEAIVVSENGYVSSTQCLNLSNSVDKLSKTEGQDALGRFCAKKWLQDNNGRVSLTPRSILELDPMLRELYPEEVADCRLCQMLLIKGSQCCNCDTKLHLHCIAEITRKTPKFKCPGCNRPWQARHRQDPHNSTLMQEDESAVEEADMTDQSQLSLPAASQSERRRRPRKRKAAD